MEDSTFYNLYGKEHYEKGIEKGIEEVKREFVKNFLDNGFSMEEISRLTDLPLEEIKSIVNDFS